MATHNRKSMPRAIISGLGYFVPDNVVTNADLEKMMDTDDAWIQERTGIRERRWVVPGEDGTASMGTKAAKRAIENAGLQPADIDFIIFATLSPDYYFPGPGVQVQEALEIDTIGALDVRNQCSGFVYALSIADQYIRSGMYKHILVIGSEYHSGGLDKTTRGRGVTVIFGDGAGAAVVSAYDGHDRGILTTHLHSEGKYAKELSLIGPSTSRWVDAIMQDDDPDDISFYPYMNGNFVFKHAVTRFPAVILEALQANGFTPADIKLLVPHQANLRISQMVAKTLNLAYEQVYNNIQKYGNTTAASIPIALSQANEKGLLEPGDLVCLAAFGSGFTWASALMRW
jgi:3-oxoacyl-[acyl-carrier-protein] synthase III